MPQPQNAFRPGLGNFCPLQGTKDPGTVAVQKQNDATKTFSLVSHWFVLGARCFAREASMTPVIFVWGGAPELDTFSHQPWATGGSAHRNVDGGECPCFGVWSPNVGLNKLVASLLHEQDNFPL